MLNIVKMDVFRLFKSKSLYIITILFAFTIWWWVGSAGADIDMGHIKRGSDIPRTARNFFMYFQTWGIMDMDPRLLFTEEGGTTSLIHMASYLLNCFITRIFPAIFVVLFISGDSSSGFIKNIVSCVKKRRFIIFSKIITMSLFILLEFLVLLIVTRLACLRFIDNYTREITLEQISYIGTQFLLYSAYTTIIILVTYTLKNAAISIIVNLLLCFNVFTTIGILLLININVELAYKISNLFVVQNMRLIWINAPSEIYIQAILVSIVAILVYSFLNSVLIDKRDI